MTILHEHDITTENLKTVKSMVATNQEAQWRCYYAEIFYGSEADKVVAVSTGSSILEMITRARSHLCVVMVDSKLDHLDGTGFKHTSYLSFFLHEQNFWRIKFTLTASAASVTIIRYAYIWTPVTVKCA